MMDKSTILLSRKMLQVNHNIDFNPYPAIQNDEPILKISLHMCAGWSCSTLSSVLSTNPNPFNPFPNDKY